MIAVATAMKRVDVPNFFCFVFHDVWAMMFFLVCM